MKFACKTLDLSKLDGSRKIYRYLTIKFDGIWCEIYKGKTGLQAITSTPTNITKKLRNQPWFRRLGVRWSDAPSGSTFYSENRIYGELISPGKPASHVSSALARNEPLVFVMFASSYFVADAPLEVVENMADFLGLLSSPYLRLLTTPALNHTQIKSACVGTLTQNPITPGEMYGMLGAGIHKEKTLLAIGDRLQENAEGYVFKNGNKLDWAKWKPSPTIDCYVTGVTMGNGKYAGTIGSVQVSVYSQDRLGVCVIADVSGMTDDERETMRELHRYGALCGQVIEVAYQYVGSRGRLRHPRFVRFRDDKSQNMCLTDQDPKLASIWG